MKGWSDVSFMLCGCVICSSLRHGMVMSTFTTTVTDSTSTSQDTTLSDGNKSLSAALTSGTSTHSTVTMTSSSAVMMTGTTPRPVSTTSMTLLDNNNATVALTGTMTLNMTTMTPWMNSSDDTLRGAFVAAEVAAIFCSVLGFTGNIFTLLTIVITPKLRGNANNLFVCNLSAADALFCAVILPFNASVLHAGSWLWDDTFCSWFAASKHTVFGIAVFSLCTIAVNRFVNVVYPEHKDRIYTRSKIAAMLVSCWLAPVVLNIPAIFKAWGEYSFRRKIRSCTYGSDDTTDTDSHGVVIYASFLAVPVVLMVVSYCSIGIVLYKSRRRMQRHRPPSGESLSRDQQGRQLTLSMLAICVLFILCVGPNTLVGIADPKMNCRTCHVITPLFTWVQISLNPVVYTMTNAQFQQAYKHLLRRIFGCHDCQSCRDCCGRHCCLRTSSTDSSSPTNQVNIVINETST
ncbi:G-protein coupled receptor moody-like [Liolophura sinensis]|uniref:G-protein coupled receptor moody-like n=1 Tax=Liolophura sinensis TaxID=3198878 RepID=UPI00315853D9